MGIFRRTNFRDSTKLIDAQMKPKQPEDLGRAFGAKLEPARGLLAGSTSGSRLAAAPRASFTPSAPPPDHSSATQQMLMHHAILTGSQHDRVEYANTAAPCESYSSSYDSSSSSSSYDSGSSSSCSSSDSGSW